MTSDKTDGGTPRTDAEAFHPSELHPQMVHADFARTIEREITARREQLAAERRVVDKKELTRQANLLLEQYWDCAFLEGQDGLSRKDSAQKILSKLNSLIRALADPLKGKGDGRDAKDAERFRKLQNMPPLQAQALFWNIKSRKQRAAAIDKLPSPPPDNTKEK